MMATMAKTSGSDDEFSLEARTLISHIPRHRHRGMRCRCGIWCDAIDAVLAHIAQVEPETLTWFKARLTGFYPLTRASARRIKQQCDPAGHSLSGAACLLRSQRFYREDPHHPDVFVRQPRKGRIELNIERCPVNVAMQRYVVAHELGHIRDLIEHVDATGARDDRTSEELERAANAYAHQWGFGLESLE